MTFRRPARWRGNALFVVSLLLGACESRPPSVPPVQEEPRPKAPSSPGASSTSAPTPTSVADDGPVDGLGVGAVVDETMQGALTLGQLPGCVVVAGTKDRILFRKAYGFRSLEPVREPMTLDTLFDLASITKPLATAASVLKLVEQGQISLDEPLARVLPELARAGKGSITARHLLLHVSGLPSETPKRDYESGYEAALRHIVQAPTRHSPGTKFVYSDAGFILLEAAVRKLAGMDVARYAEQQLFEPLGMADTMFQPKEALWPRVAPTEYRDFGGPMIRGTVHDPRAFRLGGVAGNAGLFSTAADLVRFSQAMLRGGELDGRRVLAPETLAAFTAPHDIPGGVRALGWDVRSPYSGNRGTALSPRAFGHSGYTGTVLWIDPDKDFFFVFLSNRVHPNGKGNVNALAGRIATTLGAAWPPPPSGAPACDPGGGAVVPGIDVLAAEGFSRLRGARVGLLTNSAARTKDGTLTLDVLRRAPGLSLVALFTPEHGFSAKDEGAIASGTDTSTGLPVFSLYGGTTAPTPEMLGGLDTLVVDLPDVGTRFYTYASTLKRTMEVAAERRVRVVVLDRPNPIDGVTVEGPLLDGSRFDFANHHVLPVRHGMTLGELAVLFDADKHLGTSYSVVKVEGWRRASLFPETGLSWFPPSPNLRSADEALLYPAVGLLEATNVSVGRGTDMPFEVVGAPWMDGPKLASALNAVGLPGVRFESTRFEPTAAPYSGESCGGVRLVLTDRHGFEAVRTGVELAQKLIRLHKSAFDSERLERLFAHAKVTQAVRAGRPFREIAAMMEPDLRAFREKRERYLLYPAEACPRTP